MDVQSEDPETIFKVIGQLGEGSYGVVYKGIDLRDKSEVAIKVLEVGTEGDNVEDLRREINILKQCHSPYIVRYYGTYKDRNDRIWIVMEYCGGGSLCDLMAICDRTLSEKEIAHVMYHCLLGLQYIHNLKLIHRDVKSGNILLTQRGQAKLADFGVSAELSSTIAKRNTVIGTPYWMAPEVLLSSMYDGKADVWSLGITAIELALGEPPLAHVHPMRAIFLIPNSDPPLEITDMPQYGNDFKEFIAACLVKEPQWRASVDELLQTAFIQQAIPKQDPQGSEEKDRGGHMTPGPTSSRPNSRLSPRPKTPSAVSPDSSTDPRADGKAGGGRSASVTLSQLASDSPPNPVPGASSKTSSLGSLPPETGGHDASRPGTPSTSQRGSPPTDRGEAKLSPETQPFPTAPEDEVLKALLESCMNDIQAFREAEYEEYLKQHGKDGQVAVNGTDDGRKTPLAATLKAPVTHSGTVVANADSTMVAAVDTMVPAAAGGDDSSPDTFSQQDTMVAVRSRDKDNPSPATPQMSSPPGTLVVDGTHNQIPQAPPSPSPQRGQGMPGSGPAAPVPETRSRINRLFRRARGQPQSPTRAGSSVGGDAGGESGMEGSDRGAEHSSDGRQASGESSQSYQYNYEPSYSAKSVSRWRALHDLEEQMSGDEDDGNVSPSYYYGTDRAGGAEDEISVSRRVSVSQRRISRRQTREGGLDDWLGGQHTAHRLPGSPRQTRPRRRLQNSPGAQTPRADRSARRQVSWTAATGDVPHRRLTQGADEGTDSEGDLLERVRNAGRLGSRSFAPAGGGVSGAAAALPDCAGGSDSRHRVDSASTGDDDGVSSLHAPSGDESSASSPKDQDRGAPIAPAKDSEEAAGGGSMYGAEGLDSGLPPGSSSAGQTGDFTATPARSTHTHSPHTPADVSRAIAGAPDSAGTEHSTASQDSLGMQDSVFQDSVTPTRVARLLAAEQADNERSPAVRPAPLQLAGDSSQTAGLEQSPRSARDMVAGYLQELSPLANSLLASSADEPGTLTETAGGGGTVRDELPQTAMDGSGSLSLSQTELPQVQDAPVSASDGPDGWQGDAQAGLPVGAVVVDSPLDHSADPESPPLAFEGAETSLFADTSAVEGLVDVDSLSFNAASGGPVALPESAVGVSGSTQSGPTTPPATLSLDGDQLSPDVVPLPSPITPVGSDSSLAQMESPDPENQLSWVPFFQRQRDLSELAGIRRAMRLVHKQSAAANSEAKDSLEGGASDGGGDGEGGDDLTDRRMRGVVARLLSALALVERSFEKENAQLQATYLQAKGAVLQEMERRSGPLAKDMS